MIKQAGQSCAIGTALFPPALPSRGPKNRSPALRGHQSSALAGALCHLLPALTAFTNQTLRGVVAQHLARDYSASKMSYDLRRLRLHGLIKRLPRTNTYVLTPEGIHVAVFYTKLPNRLLQPLLDSDQPPAKIEIRRALKTLENAVNQYVSDARLAPAS